VTQDHQITQAELRETRAKMEDPRAETYAVKEQVLKILEGQTEAELR